MLKSDEIMKMSKAYLESDTSVSTILAGVSILRLATEKFGDAFLELKLIECITILCQFITTVVDGVEDMNKYEEWVKNG